MRQAILVEIADHDDGGAEDTGGCGRGKPHRPGTRDINGRPDPDTGTHGAMEAGGQDIGQHRQVADLRHGLVAIREFQQVEVGVGDGHVSCLPADPAAHVDITVGTAGA